MGFIPPSANIEKGRRAGANQHHGSWRRQCFENKNIERQLSKFTVPPTSTHTTNQPNPRLPPGNADPRLDGSSQCWAIMAGEPNLWFLARDAWLRIDQTRKCSFISLRTPRVTCPPNFSLKVGKMMEMAGSGEKTSNCPGTFLLYPSVFPAICSPFFPGAWSTFTFPSLPASCTLWNLWGAKTGSNGAVTAAHATAKCRPGTERCCFFSFFSFFFRIY